MEGEAGTGGPLLWKESSTLSVRREQRNRGVKHSAEWRAVDGRRSQKQESFRKEWDCHDEFKGV